mmetsp:Transcript_3228/g.6331  ORF Transcript_3228/g.6331 Transcript_3228/m.6331 type:complete len:363 (-) Transcript_3228:226-1314(-)|eukprot:CAMPEP_0167780348 /NCGR_PEP_ID=MMETSP0111_2-20121227/5302_1 /TAXON_ID=91324 /ORGANISM="Lotharella globosa, Strain CCCM811" /LENGTH=362 /DNA_ID=CAMNT_0007670839 /DNA_START=30 /DNA_END=1118 /DNA_ORIENTATION=-
MALEMLGLLLLLASTHAKRPGPNCGKFQDRQQCLGEEGQGFCGFCMTSETCVSKLDNHCPEGCLFTELKPRLKDSQASPSCHIHKKPKNTTDYDEGKAMRLVKLSGAAYCPPDVLRRWKCPRGKCVSGFNPELVVSDEIWELQAFAGIDTELEETPRVVVSFRGTVEADTWNWVEDLHFTKVSPYEDKEISVHRGFYNAFMALRPRIMAYLDQAPKHPLVVTGHSLGAAMATLLAFDISQMEGNRGFPSVSSLTFGEPRTGNHAFHEAFSKAVPDNWRVTHADDIVPKVPFQSFGFYHTAREIWYSDRKYEAGKYRVCDGSGEDRHCQDSRWYSYSVEDHLMYLGVLLGSDGCLPPQRSLEL